MTNLLSLGSIGLMELEIMTFVISVPIPIPMPRFTNGRKTEEKDNVMENSYILFQIREAVGRSEVFQNRCS